MKVADEGSSVPDTDLSVPDTDLVLGALLEEPALRGHQLRAAPGSEAVQIAWCLPYGEVAANSESLAGVAVQARQAELQAIAGGPARALRGLAVRQCPAVFVDTASDPGFTDVTLPLVVGPPGLSYRVLGRLIAEKSIAQEAHVLAYGVKVHRALGEVLYRGSGLTTMAREIARLARCPAFLLDAHFGVLVYESLTPFAVPDPSELVRLLAAVLGELSSSDGASEGQRALVLHLVLENGPVTVVVAPIVLGASTYGWVAIVELEEPPPPHDVAQHKVIAEQGAMISGSEMLRIRSVEAAEERARGDFVHALLHARFANTHELAARAAHHDFDLKSRYAVIVVEGALEVSNPQGLERQRALVRSVDDLPARSGQRTLTATVGDLLVVVREDPQAAREATEAVRTRAGVDRGGPATASFARLLSSQLAVKLGDAVTVSYGRPGVGASGVHVSYREARIALGISRRLRLDRVCGYAELRVFAALAEVADTPEGLEFAREILEPLAKAAYGNDLERVTVAYVAHGGNLNAASRELQLHRNTMLYKVERASRLLGMDLRDPESRFTFWLAHRIHTLADVSTVVAREFDI